MRAVLVRRRRSSRSALESATTRATAANGTSNAVSRIGSARRSEALTIAGEIGGAPKSSPTAIALIPASARRLRYRACSSGSAGNPDAVGHQHVERLQPVPRVGHLARVGPVDHLLASGAARVEAGTEVRRVDELPDRYRHASSYHCTSASCKFSRQWPCGAPPPAGRITPCASSCSVVRARSVLR